MTILTLGQRIKRVRRALGEGQSTFGQRFGIDQSTISKWEKDRQTPEQHRLDLLANLEGEIGISEESGKSINHEPQALFTLVPLVGDIGAGARVYQVEGDAPSSPAGYVRAARGFGAVEALRVQGDSMWPAYRDGDMIFVESRLSDPPLIRNVEYILTLSDGRRMLKMVEPADHGRYNLISHNAPPEAGVEIVQAQRVRYVRKA